MVMALEYPPPEMVAFTVFAIDPVPDISSILTVKEEETTVAELVWMAPVVEVVAATATNRPLP
jgi:hypothetical protein